MLARIVIAPRADAELRDIRRYISRDSKRRAAAVVRRIRERFRMLRRQPLIGEPREELGPGCRSFPVGNYVIVYEATLEQVHILRVIHGARNFDVIFGLNDDSD